MFTDFYHQELARAVAAMAAFCCILALTNCEAKVQISARQAACAEDSDKDECKDTDKETAAAEATPTPTETPTEVSPETTPSSPTGFSLSNPTATSIRLDWVVGSDNTETFAVERKLPSGDWTQIASVDKDTLSYVDTTRPTGISLSYRIKAVNSVGSSDPAATVTGTAQFIPTLGFEISSTVNNDLMADIVSSAGDVNGDGKPDFLVGAQYGNTSKGGAYVYSGEDGSLLHTITGTQNTGYLGNAVSGLGDMNGDGKDDFLVAEHQAHLTGSNRGRVILYSGATGTALQTISGTEDVAKLGGWINSVGDINGDEKADYIVGEALANAGGTDRGKAYAYSGADGSLLFTFTGTENSAVLGGRVASAGDLNGDGTPDLLVGETGADAGGSDRGKAYVYSGTDGSLLRTFTGTENSANFGGGLAPAGDVNGDGKDDVLISAQLADAGGSDRGQVFVYSGADGSVLFTFTGTENNARFGKSVANPGDVNGDGKDDFFIGEWQANGAGTDRGKVYVYSGADGSLLYTFTGLEDNAYLGVSVASAGDVNGDGRPDLLIGEYAADAGGTDRGKFYVYLSP